MAALERDAGIVLVLADTRTARRLNREFRGRNYATNVLTFRYRSRPQALADIVVCVPVARSEAKRFGRSLRQHLAHLLVHGALHAQGYDHETSAAAARRMEAKEKKCMALLGFPDPYA